MDDAERRMGRLAETLWRASQRDRAEPSPILTHVLRHLGPARTVLDIGVGVGRFAVPLARDGVRVEALEPSATMREYLARHSQDSGVAETIDVNPASWPTESAGVAEVALAAFVVHFSDDPVAFVRAMERHATIRVVVAVHVDPLFARWREVLGSLAPDPRQGRPWRLFKHIYPVLLEADIVPDVEVFQQSMGPRWSTEDEAAAALAERFEITDAAAQAELRQRLRAHPDVWQQPAAVRAAIMSWAPPPAAGGGDSSR